MAKKQTDALTNLVIVESPAKAKTIEKFLGSDFVVKSSYGHIRDLAKADFGIDIKNNYQPQYVVSDDKKEVVRELKSLAANAQTVWLASDEDREGEAIAWHLFEELNLKDNSTRRIVFHEITKDAILKAVQHPRAIDKHLVDAQQARRVLDRLVGFELSPVLWKKVKPSLSAGRVQSVAVRLLVEREREIFHFESKDSYRVAAVFTVAESKGKVQVIKAELSRRFETLEQTREFLQHCVNASFLVDNVEKKPATKSPAPPFTTSTLQQEAARKLGFSVSQTMSVAQKLYEAGKITYMRTDSVNLSDVAIASAASVIRSQMGEKYHYTRQFKTKAKGAQEAHEAIRPTYLQDETIVGSSAEQRLYELIWKRTIASQMADAQLERTVISISVQGKSEQFVATGEVIRFDGFLKVYIESNDHDKEGDDEQSLLLPPVEKNQVLTLSEAEARQRWNQKPARYTEASLVRKLEELGIGRPSTYAPTISTIQQRGYVVKEERPGVERKYQHLLLKNGQVLHSEKIEISGAEKNKLFPTDIGIVVNDFLVKYFQKVMDFDFTANVEKEFDEIAEGKLVWQKVIDRFYKPFHLQVEETIEKSERNTGERILGNDPESGKVVLVKIGRFGPMAQIGESDPDSEEKPRFASLRTGQHIETISLDEALDLFRLPRDLGEFESYKVVVAIGRFGPYVRHNGKFVSIKKGDDPYEISLERAIQLILDKREEDNNKLIRAFDDEPELKILNGRWGPYISFNGGNYKIPKNTDAATLSKDDCMKLIESQPAPKKSGRFSKTAKAAVSKSDVATSKKVAQKKTTTKKTTTKSGAKSAKKS
ncbi:DNA topoisomerase-1 [Breznakibacter xylanolyticus]|uniref:DNA topoisomerase 1 n=1 Tax=Breznakibacter xylanolyticus TaxID=990 RepID=A0A2W7N672_9BACT|nr:type I DNA topoisomerase [Breznakibacter xylanolyticus]PZX15925.1 DNA topoisomerase-1 [Breznakibacter xylanolyticus]